MVLHDDRTGRGHPLPHPDNLLEDDVQRLRAAIDGLDRDATALETGKAGADLSNVPDAAFKAKAASVGLSLPAVTVGDAGKSLIVNPAGTGYQVGAAGSAIQQSGPLYAPGGSGFSLTGRSVVAAYEQIAGQTFNIGYTTESDYAQQDAANGTDASGGAFVLHNTAGAVIDGNTKLLIHADGVNGSTEIIDERGITPFGTHCAYFDGTAYFTIPSSYKIAFGSSQNFTFEGWARVDGFDANNQTDILQVYTGSTMHLAFNYGGDASMRVGSGGGFSTAVASGVPVGSWFHWAIVRNAGTMKGYVNGVEKISFSETYNYPSAFIALGRRATNNTCFQTGWQDQVRVSKVARYIAAFSPPTAEFTTDADTVHLFQFNDGHGSQFIRDAAKSGHPVTLSSSLTNTRSKFGTTALSGGLRVSGDQSDSSEHAHADFLIGSDSFTADAWIYPTAWGSAEASIFGFSNGVTYSASLTVNTSGTLKIYLSDNGTSYNLQNGTTVGSLSLNAWQHMALVRSGTSVYVFVNGVAIGTYTVGSSAAITFAAPMFLFNRSWASGTSGFVGQSSELRLKRGQAAWTSNFTPPTSAYTTDDYTILLCHFEGANGDKVTLDSSESSYGINGFSDTTTPILDITTSGGLTTTYTRGGNSTSMQLNGSSQYASTAFATYGAGHPWYFAPGEKFCIEFWVYIAGSVPGSGGHIPLFVRSAANTSEFYIAYGTGGVGFSGGYGGSADQTFGASTTAPVVGWNHIAVVREGRGYVVYVNGAGSTPVNPHKDLVYSGTTLSVKIGSYTAQYVNGAIDSFRITHGKPRYEANFTPGNLTQDADTALLWVFNGASGQKWVKELSKNTALISSTNARTVKDGRWGFVSVGNAVKSITQSKFGGASLYFPTANDYISFSSTTDVIPGSGDFTVDFWIYLPATGVRRLMCGRTSGTNTLDQSNWECTLWEDSTLSIGYPGSAGAKSSAGTWGLGWNHVAFSRSGNTLYMFCNGSLIGSPGFTRTLSSTAPFCIGALPNEGMGSVGCYIDEFRYSNTARWTANFTPPTLPYGQQYVTGPHWVATKPGASSLDLSAFSSIDSASFSGGTPPTTSLTYLISTDGYATPLKRWTGSAWVATAHGMTWAAPTLTTTATAAQLNAVGNSWAELSAGLAALDVSAVGSLNVVAVLSTANPQYTPSLDAITLNMDEYQLMQPGADYTVRRRKANGVQTLTFTRVKAGNANHVVDCVG